MTRRTIKYFVQYRLEHNHTNIFVSFATIVGVHNDLTSKEIFKMITDMLKSEQLSIYNNKVEFDTQIYITNLSILDMFNE